MPPWTRQEYVALIEHPDEAPLRILGRHRWQDRSERRVQRHHHPVEPFARIMEERQIPGASKALLADDKQRAVGIQLERRARRNAVRQMRGVALRLAPRPGARPAPAARCGRA